MIILDASIILKWFLVEEDRDIALVFLDRHINGDIKIAVPEILCYELSNILALKTELSEEIVTDDILDFFEFGLQIISLGQREYIEAIRLSRLYKISVYDASYIVLAKSLNADFVTADEKLVQKMKDMPFVQTLKNYQI
jgi:predicted nucleic acid-binding protein